MPVDSNKLSNMLSIISEKLMEKKISCCVIGAMALGLDMKKTVMLINNQRSDRLRIFKMMEASCELAIQKGRHELEKGCNCIACVNKRKRILHGTTQKWKFTL